MLPECKSFMREKICWHIIIFDIYFMFFVLTYYRYEATYNNAKYFTSCLCCFLLLILKSSYLKKSEIEIESIRILQQQQLYELTKHKQYKVHSI